MNQEKNLSLDELIQTYSSLKYNEQKTKVRFWEFFKFTFFKVFNLDVLSKVICEWSGHEMPARAEAVLVYVNGNKYKALSRTKINNDELKKYSEFLITKPKQRNKFV